eukprot:m.1204622 g.1204622  ORF g.1204622 m.1204622 type:complete len:870 (-) comp24581_c0_seq2:2274-4883(-)
MGQGSSKEVQQLRAQTDTCLWSVLSGESTEYEPITIFEHTYQPDDKQIVKALLENSIQQLKKLRYPSIVKFQWVQRAEDSVSVVTEPVVPLNEAYVSELEADELCYGLYNIGKALQFLHEDAGELAHGNLHLECVFVGDPDGEWRLGHLEHTKLSKDLNIEYLRDTSAYRDSRTVTPEETACLANSGTMEGSSGQERDVFAFGHLVVDVLENVAAEHRGNILVSLLPTFLFGSFISHVFDGFFDSVVKQSPSHWISCCYLMHMSFAVRLPCCSSADAQSCRSQDEIPQETYMHVTDAGRFLEYAKRELLSPSPRTRPSISKVLQHAFFANNALVKAKIFLKTITVKTSAEKERFFTNLKRSIKKFPSGLVVRQLLRQLLSRVMLTEPTMEQLGRELLCPRQGSGVNGVLPEPEFREHVIPLLLKLFSVRDLRVRLALLPTIAQYSSLFTHEQLDGIVLPELRMGLQDSNDVLARATMQALTDVAAQYSGSIMGGARRTIFADMAQRAQAVLPVLAVDTDLVDSVNDDLSVAPGNATNGPAADGVGDDDADNNTDNSDADDDVLTPEDVVPATDNTDAPNGDGDVKQPSAHDVMQDDWAEDGDASDWADDNWGGDDDDFGVKPGAVTPTTLHTDSHVVGEDTENADGSVAHGVTEDENENDVLTPDDPVHSRPRVQPTSSAHGSRGDTTTMAAAKAESHRDANTPKPPVSQDNVSPAPHKKKKGLQLSGKAKKVIKKRESTGGDAGAKGGSTRPSVSPRVDAAPKAAPTTPTTAASPAKHESTPPSPEPDFFADMTPQIRPAGASLIPDRAKGSEGVAPAASRTPPGSGSGRLAAASASALATADADDDDGADGDGWGDGDDDDWGDNDA